jgi:FtsH-binding integral membrane protein
LFLVIRFIHGKSYENINVLLLGVCVIAALSLLFTLGVRMPKEEKDMLKEAVKEPVKMRKGLRWNDVIEPKALPISLVGFTLAFSYSSLSGFIASFTIEINQSQLTGYFCLCDYDCAVSTSNR